MGYFDEIHYCPSKIYHVLPFCPPSSWLHEYYGSELVKVVRGFQTTWGVCSRTVSFDDIPKTLTYWKDIIAAGFESGQIIILDAVTGIQMAILPKHTSCVTALTFSSDGTTLASGSNDRTIKLWDIQTGGLIRTILATSHFLSISISVDNGTIACLYMDGRIGLWDTNPRGIPVTTNYDQANSVSFSLTNPKVLLIASSISDTVLQWNIDTPEPMPIHGDIHIWSQRAAFSFDRTCWILSQGSKATVYKSGSGMVIARLQAPCPDSSFHIYWSISPSGKYVICSFDTTVFVWEITGTDPHLVNTFIGHTGVITSAIFSSFPISSSSDQSIKFWQIGPSSTELGAADEMTPSSTSPPPITISIQAKDKVAISVDEAGVVKTWDLSTGLCKASFSTPAISNSKRDIQLIGDRVIFVWCTKRKMHIWDAKKGTHHQTTDLISDFSTTVLRISGDGSKVFVLDCENLQALSTRTGKVIGSVRSEGRLSDDPLTVDGSRVWIHFEDSQTEGWDFESAPIPLSDTPPVPDKSHLNFINCAKTPGAGLSRVKDTATGKEVFQLPGRFKNPTMTQWDGRYLVAGYPSGEVLILDFNRTIPQ